MSFASAAIMIGASIGSSLIAANAAKSAAQSQANAANRATDTQLQMFNTINQQQAPWRQAGANALKTINTLQPQFTHQFNAADLKTNLAPNYQFQLDQGLGALKNASNMQTGLVSGNALKGVNDYAQNFAGNAYQNAFANYSANQTNIFNRLSNIAGLGQTANANVGNQGTALAGNAGNAQMAAGAAQAAGTVGASNAITGGLSNIAGWFGANSFLNSGGGGGGGFGGGGGGGGLPFDLSSIPQFA